MRVQTVSVFAPPIPTDLLVGYLSVTGALRSAYLVALVLMSLSEVVPRPNRGN